MDVKSIIEKYQLIPHPEGGYYREVYRSKNQVLSPVTREERNAITQIYFLLSQGQVSRFHKVLHDEIWNFYEGSPLKLIRFDGEQIEKSILGPENYISVIKADTFQAAESMGCYTLVGCSVAPGFDFKDFSFIEQDQNLSAYIKTKFPEYSRFI